jgi:O-antigen ligase
MSNNAAKAFLILSAAALFVVVVFLYRPDYFSTAEGLGFLLGAAVLVSVVANYRKAFLPATLICFLVAGTGLPFHGVLLQERWIVLAVGALLGLAVYLKTHVQSFKLFHLVALFCVLSALVSASVSAYPDESLLKAVSFLLLFVYAAAGARTAVPLDPERFFRGLVLGVEILVWASALCYFVLRFEVYGNPNSLGAVMSVAAIPVILWAFLTAQWRTRRLRLGIELMLALALLLSSFSRASIGAAIMSCFVVCVSLRQYRILVRGIVVTFVLAACVILFVPRSADGPSWDESESMSSIFLYKGKSEQGLFGSRRSVWQQTWDVIQEKPWFGSGFGTSAIAEDMTKLEYAQHHIDSWVIREHGNSYLAIAEWTGLLGVVPFFALAILVAASAVRTFLYVRRTSDYFSQAVPLAAIVLSGLVHAIFEDWMFAVGYYVCVFFWVMAFILVDLAPVASVATSPERTLTVPSQSYGAVPSFR